MSRNVVKLYSLYTAGPGLIVPFSAAVNGAVSAPLTGCERSGNGAERAKTRMERSVAVSGSQKKRAERSGA